MRYIITETHETRDVWKWKGKNPAKNANEVRDTITVNVCDWVDITQENYVRAFFFHVFVTQLW